MQENLTAPQPVAVVDRPGHNLGLAGFIVSFFVSIAGLIMSIIALRQSRAAGQSNGFAVAGIVIGALGTLSGLLVFAFVLISFLAYGGTAAPMGSM